MTYLSGTTRCNHIGLPGPVKRKLAKTGGVVNYQRGPLLACTFEDKKHGVILSTFHKVINHVYQKTR